MQHLTREQLNRYREGKMNPAELAQADEHIASCQQCRQMLMTPNQLEQAVLSLKRKLQFDRTRESNCLDYSRLVAYIDGELDEIDREIVEAHLELCPRCAEDVQSLRQFRDEIATRPTVTYAPKARLLYLIVWFRSLLSTLKPQNVLSFSMATALIVLFCLFFAQLQTNQTLFAELELTRERLKQLETQVARTQEIKRHFIAVQKQFEESQKQLSEMRRQLLEAQRKLASAEQFLQKQTTMVQKPERRTTSQPPRPPFSPPILVTLKDTAGEITLSAGGRLTMPSDITLPPEWMERVKEVLTKGAASQPEKVLLALAETKKGTILRGTEILRQQVAEFPMLISPVATAVKSTRPLFRWMPVKGAQSYRLIVTNKDQTEIIWQGETKNQTQIELPVELKRDEIYSWQVEAKVGDEVRLSQWAKFWVLDEGTFAQVGQLERKFGKSAIVMATVYQSYGLYDDAWTQLERVRSLNPNNPSVESLRESFLKQRIEVRKWSQ